MEAKREGDKADFDRSRKGEVMLRIIPFKNDKALYQHVFDWFTRTRTFGWVGAQFDDDGYELGGGHCVYRGPNNERCGIGCAIPDALYNPDWDRDDGVGIGSLLGMTPSYTRDIGLSMLFANVDNNDLSALQLLHDGLAERASGDGEAEACMDELLSRLQGVIDGTQTIQQALASA